jgi:membrane protein implicated in regulation of membrane protease activity
MRQRRNVLWGIIAVCIAAILLLISFDVLPVGVEDVFARSWSALLVVVGLAVLLRNRLPLGGVIAIVVSVLMVGVAAYFAYSTRATQEREDNQQVIDQSVSEGVSLLQINLDTLTTDVQIALSDTERVVGGEFSGSLQSNVEVDYIEDNTGLGILTVRETKPESFPPLEAVGRGSLTLEVPPDLPVDIAFSGSGGDATLNLNGVDLERLNVNLQQGNALITMPEYEPRSEAVQAQRGSLTVENGDITLFIPEDVAARLELNTTREPEFDSTVYQNFGGVLLENRNFNNSDIVIQYVLVAPRGTIRVQTAQ